VSPSSSAACAPTPSTAVSPRCCATRPLKASSCSSSPFYNEEIDTDDAASAVLALRGAVASSDRVLAVTPEYNGTMPAVLNNALDWLSRPYGAGAIVGKPFGVIGTTPTPYGGKWAHADAARSAGIAGARVVESVVVSQPGVGVDVLTDPEVRARLLDALRLLVEAEEAPVAA
jgi:NAD(P)H-dependent FMN reductase